MKTIVIGDIHGRRLWQLIIHKEKDWDQIVFIGDYFDTHREITPIEQLKNFDDVCKFKKKSEKPVILLIGNHDYHYFPEIGYNGTSGYQSGAAKNIEFALDENRNLLQMAYMYDNILFTHAGVGETWLKKHFKEEQEITNYLPNIAERINDLWKYKPQSFQFDGWKSQTGDEIGQTPIWIRPYSLIKDSKILREAGIIQIIGHTQVKKLDVQDGKKFGCILIDTLEESREYLIINDREFSVGQVGVSNN
jgi:predicted MPP superfamily phosphohydrolase